MKPIKRYTQLNEGFRVNNTYLSLSSGEHNITEVLLEVKELEEALTFWIKGGWKSVTSLDNEHKEIIPLSDLPKK